jgi:lycopene beta-cyclase
VLLNVLAANYYPGDEVFATLFEKNPAHRVFQFLDNETNLLQELQIISSLPTWPFLKAALLHGCWFYAIAWVRFLYK